jgi:hypothetical protein
VWREVCLLPVLIQKEMITVYPNPVSENLHFSEEVSTIKILDISGKVIIQTFTAGNLSM